MAAAPTTSAGRSSPEDYDPELDDDEPHSSSNWHGQDATGSDEGAAPNSPTASTSKPTLPMQKRRRVTRACDECRRKKIKCDGKQPCTHCTVYSYDCTYDQPSNRRRNPAPHYIETLEFRLHRAEALLKTYAPAINLNDPNFDALLQQRIQANNRSQDSMVSPSASEGPNSPLKGTPGSQEDANQDAKIRSMIEATGQLDLDEHNKWDFHGSSSGAVFLKRLREKFGGLLPSGDSRAPFLPRQPNVVSMGLGIHESPNSASGDSPFESGSANVDELPPKAEAKRLCVNSLTRACALLRFVHQPSFYVMVDRIYDIPAESYSNEEHLFLPLLYSVIALGSVFGEDGEDMDNSELTNYNDGIEQGYKYFRAAMQMMDVTNCRDLISLQALIFLILFLQSSANLSVCYAYIGIALRSSIQMGLHRKLHGNPNYSLFNPIERETRRRVFWLVRKLDCYVSALLGFPQSLSDEDIDQEYPSEIDDEYITKDQISPQPPGTLSLIAATNANTRLLDILAKVIKYIYPVKGLEQSIQGGGTGNYVISHTKIKEIEMDLQEWLDNLPMELRPSDQGGSEVSRYMLHSTHEKCFTPSNNFPSARQLLRIAYAHVQMMLYRPFLHYVSSKNNASKVVDERSYACAAACVSVSRNIVHITVEMKRRGLLVGAYWFTMYTTFFAILSLAYFVIENPDKPGSQEILADAQAGRDALKGLARRSLAADRCSKGLANLFEKLPEHLKRGRGEPSISNKKKRSAPSPNPRPQTEIQSVPNLTESLTVSVPRAKKLPAHALSKNANRQPLIYNPSQYHPQNAADTNNNFGQQSLRDLVPSLDGSTVESSNSSSTGNAFQSSPFGMQQTYGDDGGPLPDLGPMMFPSADPFAYPNQPMMELDSRTTKQEMLDSMVSDAQPNMYLGGDSREIQYDNLEGQLFGPPPPYLMQGQLNMDVSGQINMCDDGMNDFSQAAMVSGGVADGNNFSAAGANSTMNFDGIFGGNSDNWTGMPQSNQAYGQ